MNMKRIWTTFAGLAVLAIALPAVAETPNILLAPESSISLVGDSTLHPFSCKSAGIVLSSALDPAVVSAAPDIWNAVLQKNALKQMRLTVPVKTLKSKESALDKNMYKALKAESYPDIVFDLKAYEVQPSTITPAAFHIKASGTLQVSGGQQTIELHAEAIPEAAGHADGQPGLRVQGQYALMMTDYGVKPPTLLMGTIKVKNEVIIHFDLYMR